MAHPGDGIPDANGVVARATYKDPIDDSHAIDSLVVSCKSLEALPIG